MFSCLGDVIGKWDFYLFVPSTNILQKKLDDGFLLEHMIIL